MGTFAAPMSDFAVSATSVFEWQRRSFVALVLLVSAANGSPFTRVDNLTEQTYVKNSWNAAHEDVQLSYTSVRALVPQFNVYRGNELSVVGYYYEGAQHDGRLDGGAHIPDEYAGRGSDLSTVDAFAYDKIIVGFLGIVGDRGQNERKIKAAAAAFLRAENETTFLDPWGDVQACRNNGFDGCVAGNAYELFVEARAQGVIGGLIKMKKERNPNLVLGFSVGSWTLSEAFRRVAAHPHSIDVFTDSVVDIFRRFPSFSAIDIYWEYPNAAAIEGQPYGPEDPPNFANLIANLKGKLKAAGRADVAVSVGTACTREKLEAANIPALLAAGVDAVHVMTYDYFGTPWAAHLAHHTNLHSTSENFGWSVRDTVDFLLRKGVPSRKIFIGYSGYSRNARNATVQRVSPLRGAYVPGASTTTGTFNSGKSEFHDVLYNYLELGDDDVRGKNNFTLYTDDEADADFLYNAESRFFVSLDTPRSVKAKAEFAKARNLGGVFTLQLESDRGALVNAAREGLGHEILKQVVSMKPYYKKGKTRL